MASLAQDHRYSFTESKMGSPFTIVLYARDSADAGQIARQSYRLVDSLVNMLSDYIDSSELNRLCASAGKHFFSCSPVLYDLLLKSKKAWYESEGKFDITLGPLTRLWRAARKSGQFPDSAAVNDKKKLTGFEQIIFDTAKHAVMLKQPGMQLDPGGIGQGYIAEYLAAFLRNQSVTAALINVSGDIVAIGRPPGTRGWTVAINVPESESELLSRRLLIDDRAVTTSGDVYQFLIHDGKKYSHIINPATGFGITSQRNVTVIAADGVTADWLTKAFSLLSLSKTRKLARRLSAEFLIAEVLGGRVRFHRSRSFDTYWKKAQH